MRAAVLIEFCGVLGCTVSCVSGGQTHIVAMGAGISQDAVQIDDYLCHS